ncbi:hypothetical protein QBC38DRAFT_132389 [Podospora fimiseda]|uniref:Uncharacterized protein n=1 Tax=Podospora fimiseda TaxID=252190 RepID=A0AAN7BST4_9PEZI|nr:hypothetical protein QBC38DRAFT_132389 [Podospora fimiseda]
MSNPKNLFGVLDVQDDAEYPVQSPVDSPSDEELEKLVTSTENNGTGEAPSTAVEMPLNGNKRPNTPKREADLTALLTISEKNEAVALIGKVTDLMQKHITILFDIVLTDDNSQPPMRESSWNKLPTHLKDLTLKPTLPPPVQRENLKPLPPKKASRGRDRVEEPTPSTVEAPPQPRAQPKLSPRQQELKKEALQHFKRWQTAVHKRAGDMSIKKPADSQGYAGGGKRGSASHKKRRSTSKFTSRSCSTVPLTDNEADPRTANNATASTASSITVEGDPMFWKLYPPVTTSLTSLPTDKRCLLLHAMVLLMLSLEHYGAYTRVLLLHLTSSLRLPLRILTEDEVRVAKAFSNATKGISMEELMKKAEESKASRRTKLGLAGATGAAAIGGSGGLPAALLAAGVGTIPGSSVGLGSVAAAGLLGALAENGLIVGACLGIHGARATGKSMEHYSRDVADFGFVPLHSSVGEDLEIGRILPTERRFRVIFCAGGWVGKGADVTKPWRCLGEQNEVYALRWELNGLSKLSAALDTLVRSAAWSTAKKEIIARTSEPRSLLPRYRCLVMNADSSGPVYTRLLEDRWPAGLIKISKVIDTPWINGMIRADKLGNALADIIMSKAHGERGVSLVGYSIGARAIYVCLATLAERRAFGLVENAVMMGTPAPSETAVWCAMRSVVTGRLVNVYSENDYMLGFLSRTSSFEYGVAGLQRVVGIDTVENVDISAEVSGHLRYQYLVGSILQHIGWEDIDKSVVANAETEMACWEDRMQKHEAIRDGLLNAKVEVVKKDESNKENEGGVAPIRTHRKKQKGRR